jgi:SAM-dependent methyltransferase
MNTSDQSVRGECEPFDSYGDYYDLLYGTKDYPAEARYIDSLIREFRGGRSLLDLGCGTGKHARRLVDLGYQVTGVERSRRMADKITPSKNFSCHVGDMTSISLGGQFDTVTALFHVVSYLTSNAQISALFDNVARHLKPAGLFIFDVWYSPAVAHMKPDVRVKRARDSAVEIIRIAEPTLYVNENLVEVHYTMFVRKLHEGTFIKLEETHRMRHFSIPEMQFLSDRHGFKVLKIEEYLSAEQPSERTWGCAFVLRRR